MCFFHIYASLSPILCLSLTRLFFTLSENQWEKYPQVKIFKKEIGLPGASPLSSVIFQAP